MRLPQLRAAYPKFAAALEAMFWKVAGHRRFAKTLARRAGLRSGGGNAGPQTIIAGYIHPFEEPKGRIYMADLTMMESVALSSESSSALYVILEFPGNPGNYIPLRDPDGVPVSASTGSPSGWVTLQDGLSNPARLYLSSQVDGVETNGPGISAEAWGGSFEVLLEGD